MLKLKTWFEDGIEYGRKYFERHGTITLFPVHRISPVTLTPADPHSRRTQRKQDKFLRIRENANNSKF